MPRLRRFHEVPIEETLIVGLGNPETEYADTRHNLGFACVRELARRLGAGVTRKRWRSLAAHSEASKVVIGSEARASAISSKLSGRTTMAPSWR